MDSWANLDEDERFRIALEVARRRGRELSKISGNIIGVGAGFRTRGPGNALVRDVREVCLRYLVKRKWVDSRSRQYKIPSSIKAYPVVRGKRTMVLIPTDVSEFRGGRPHGNLDLTSGITSRQGGVALDYGSACCLVRNLSQPAKRYLLSCYHLFSPRMAQPRSSGSDCIASGSGSLVGNVFSAADPDRRPGIDAALVLIDDPSVETVSVWGRFPVSRATDHDVAMMYKRGPFVLLCRRVAPRANGLSAVTRPDYLSAEFLGILPIPFPFNYKMTAGSIYFFSDTIEYLADVRPGDSGAALIDGAAKLYGMHFYGNGNVGYAMSAPNLFAPKVFEVEIELSPVP